jgi:hypothetical protein
MATDEQNQELQHLQIILQFLNRVDLKGNEVPAFNAVLAYLQGKGQPLMEAGAGQQAQESETVSGAPLPSTNE